VEMFCKQRLFGGFLAVAMLVAGTAGSAKEGREHTEAERDAAASTYYGCLEEQARALDDGISSAEVIGKAIAGMCEAEGLALAETFGPFRSKRSKRMFLEMQDERALETATTVVLKLRAS